MRSPTACGSRPTWASCPASGRSTPASSDLDLQVNLLAEHELTRLVALVDAMARKMGVDAVNADELREIEQDVSPEAVLDELESNQAPQ